jgi:hypothetical protein
MGRTLPDETRAERRKFAHIAIPFQKATAASGCKLTTALRAATADFSKHPMATLLRDGKADFCRRPTPYIVCSTAAPPAAFFYSWPFARARAVTVSGICPGLFNGYAAAAIDQSCTRVLRELLPNGAFIDPAPPDP